MSLDENMDDLEMHALHCATRAGFTYTVLDGDAVIGCVSSYPATAPGHDASVASWARADRASLDPVVYRSVSAWLADAWPFERPAYASRVQSSERFAQFQGLVGR
jgi:hypothetical protein